MTICIRWNGHYKNGDSFKHDKYLREHLAHIKRDLDGIGRKFPTLAGFDSCPYCDARLKVQITGNTATLNPRCTNPAGLSKTTFELNVPSGKLVIANDLRSLFPVLQDFSVNGVVGSLATTQEYAGQGMAHGFVGNSCPRVFRMGDGKADTYVVASLALPEHWTGKKYVTLKRKSRWRGKQIASVCTDLWWYSMADLDECNYRAAKLGLTLEEFNIDIVDIKPGVYKFIHDCRADQDKPGVDTIYATFKWVRAAGKEKTGERFDQFMTRYESPGRVFLQHLKDSLPEFGPDRTWDEIPEGERAEVLARVASHLMVTIGNGVEWHEGEKGSWPLSKVDADIQDIPIPEFDFQYGWYPLSYEYCAMITVPNLAPDWARLGFNILRSMLKYGWPQDECDDGDPKVAVLRYPEADRPKQLRVLQAKWDDTQREHRRRLRDAAKVYRECRKRYPEIAAETPEFDAWFEHEASKPLGERDRKAWAVQVPGRLKTTD